MKYFIKDAYNVECNELPKLYRNSYSEYGKSINDLCVIHKENYKLAAVVSWSSDEEGSEIEDDGDENEYDGISESLEFKNYSYTTQQAVKEMLKNAGV